jgi:outer membrane receptor protein involved in Fe transport
MRIFRASLFMAVALSLGAAAFGTIFGNVRGVVHDPQHRPIAGAVVVLRAQASQWSARVVANGEGEFEFSAVQAGDYLLEVKAAGFQPFEQRLTVTSGSAPILHCQLAVKTVRQKIEVSGTGTMINTESSSAETLVNRQAIARTPGAGRANSMAMITDYVPGAYMVHDMLHVRGGHQVTWEVDGVPVPNTNIATNVGPQFNPLDADYIEMKTGGYSAEYGDRTYGVFNVVPRSGFEYQNNAELVANYGSYNQTNDQLSFGSHTERFAYYGSLDANRSDLGLMTPVSAVIHDMDSGLGGFGSFFFNATPKDQLRLVASVRGDHYQIPNTPDQQSAGIRDLNIERDAFVNFSWIHTFSPSVMLNVSPFYHFNRADYLAGPNDTPFILNDNRRSKYAGAQVTLSAVEGKHNAQAGFEGFGQFDDTFFGLESNPPSGTPLRQSLSPSGNLEAVFIQDQYRATSWLSLNGGVRLTRYSGLLSETAYDPRVGAAVRMPKLNWVFRGFYGRYYQPPPLDTVSGPLLEFALQQGVGFLPLHGERDEEYQAGLTIPLHNWVFDTDLFRTHARNFFDHDAVGNSNIFLPLTVQGARIQGWEATLRAPMIAQHVRAHLAYSHQFAQALGAVTGGLTDFEPPEEGFFWLDHDQRNTLSAVLSSSLPWQTWATTCVAFGSGFLNGDGPEHLPAHTTFDISFGKSFAERWSLAVNALNVGNSRYLLDNSNTFGGTHYFDPRQVYVQVRYRFHY